MSCAVFAESAAEQRSRRTALPVRRTWLQPSANRGLVKAGGPDLEDFLHEYIKNNGESRRKYSQKIPIRLDQVQRSTSNSVCIQTRIQSAGAGGGEGGCLAGAGEGGCLAGAGEGGCLVTSLVSVSVSFATYLGFIFSIILRSMDSVAQ